jgi:flagellar motor protein MotB
VNKSWFYHAKDSIYDGLLNSISAADKKYYAQIYKAKNWNDYLIANGPILQDKVFNKYVELSHIDSFGNYYISMNNRFVNDSDKFLLQTYRYFYDTKRSKYVFEGLGLEQYSYNVSSFVLNTSRTKGLFCSDMPGALGKSDIWICDVSFNKDGEIVVSNQTNLGPKVNTILSESDPTFLTDEIIAFSSEGRLGFGGFDIYFYNLTTSEVANAGKKINTTNDEYFPKYYNQVLSYSVTNKLNNNTIYSVNIPLDIIYEAVQTILPSVPVVLPPPSETIYYASNTLTISSTLDKIKKENVNKYDYYRTLWFVLLSDSERMVVINKIDSTANYKDYKFMTLFHIDNEFVIEKDFEKELEIIAALLNKRPDWGMEIRSYTDSRGAKSKNQKLSQNRANYVAHFLELKGVNPQQILPIGYGESILINHCADGIPCTEEEHRQNRRTELIVTPVFFWNKGKG